MSSSLDITRLFGVRGYVAVVTGGASGLGFMICKGLVTNGAKVYVVSLPHEPIDQRVAELNELGKAQGGSAIGYPCNVSSKEAIADLATYIGQHEAHLDILVSNAGIRRDPQISCDVLKAPLLELQASMWSSKHTDWADTFCINTTAHYFLSVALFPLLSAASELDLGDGRKGREEGRGVIIITSSCASMHNATNVDLTSYASSKAATDHLVRLLAAKFSRFYVRVAGINPGFVPSNMNPVGEAGNMFSALFDQVPAGRAGNEEDIASAVLYLTSRAAVAHGLTQGLSYNSNCTPYARQDLQRAAMSIVALATDFQSSIDLDDLRRFASQIGFEIIGTQDAEDYLLLLRSLESVMQFVKDGADYVPTSLKPHSVSEPRKYWVPEPADNPLNAWSHRCNLQSNVSTSTLLAGKTVAIKDNISVGGLPTTLGTLPQMLSNDGTFPISQIDATVVSRILAAGAIISGTSTCESFCASPLSWTSATGPVHNPLLHGYTAGGSSSGSCALVAAHVLPQELRKTLGETCQLAIGSDQAGSVRIPACYNGIYGLKPTFGLVPYTGAASMTSMIDHLGPIAPTLEDLAALLKIMAGYDGLDTRMTPESPLLGQVKDYPQILADFRQRAPSKQGFSQKLRVGILKESFSVSSVSPEVKDTVFQAAKSFFTSAGAEVVEVSVPMHLDGPALWTASTRPSMSSWLCQGKPGSNLSYLAPHIAPKWPPTQETYELLKSSNPAVINIILSEALANDKFGPVVEAKAHRKVLELRAAYDSAFENVDILVTPCAPTIAMPHPRSTDEQGNPCTVLERLNVAVGLTNNTCPFNVSGHPAMSVPCGFLPAPGHNETKLPVGMQLIGRRFEDETVILAAALLEEGKKVAAG
ncbi:hypothetical protein G7046_g3033 [Stylonectria norvegica]|nr:hypothetical protein G7046_g3033 [Stylonectria norvegica]